MEASDSSRSPLGIDLNEIPSTTTSSETTSLCGACGKAAEAEGDVVVCDACERGFHLNCAGILTCSQQQQQQQKLPGHHHLLEWVCADCVKTGAKSKLWPLGCKKRILDINASPPSDVDVDADTAEALLDFRKHSPGDNSFGGDAFVAPVTYSKYLDAENGFGYQKGSVITVNTGKTSFEVNRQSTEKSFREVELRFPLGVLSSRFCSAIRFPSQNPSEILLQALRDFISERHGILEEGWSVELRHSTNSYELYAVYCAPDGRTFDSMSEVACYLGLTSGYNSVGTKTKAEESPLHDRVRLSKKRKTTKFAIASGAENKGFISFTSNNFQSNCQHMENFTSRSNSMVDITAFGRDEKICTVFQQSYVGLPVQFEDFFILALGHVDARPSYHNVNLIYPAGYTSCWHDKITGSLFICEVLDGGDSGPIFKVTRCSCSAMPVPDGSTILFRPNFTQCSGQDHESNVDFTSYSKDYDDVNIQMILSDPCPPVENDILTCLGSSSNENCDDDIGEISVEDHSSSSAWRKMSQKFIDTCFEIYKQKGVIKLSCKHTKNRKELANWNMTDEKEKMRFTFLNKYCGSSSSISIPSEFQGENELDKLAEVLLKWLDQDRFGLEAEFVQELIEQLPGVKGCLQYEFLMDRSCYSSFYTVGNGSLMVRKSGIGSLNEGLDGWFGRSNKPRLIDVHDHQPPPGKALCLRLPSQVVGDFFQVCEFLWRFHEVLGLKESFSLEALEEEIINPWIDGTSPEKCERKLQGTEPLSLQHTAVMGGQIFPASNESHEAISRENPHSFMHLANEADQVGEMLVSYSRSAGVVLTKAHSSLLEVLIAELQSKVAALVDPNFDSGEPKPRRGRKKDTDSSIPHKRGKLNMLPINELTWPELARRYILAFLSMDGILDSPEITARESGRVFCCLQGDGGVLCGSLTGVAGMEADALLLAEATKKIFGSLDRENDFLTIEDEVSDASGNCEKNIASDGTLPEWAKLLEPVRKLPTNVGTRIRKCVYEALEKHPPDWAKKILEHSISKEVYKGNASGPTKKAVVSVLADVTERLPQKSERGCKKTTLVSIPGIIMKQCRIVLRQAAAADEERAFCNLLGRKPLSSFDNDDEGFLGSPAMVSRPLDFRTIDFRLALGAYDGSHHAFLEDVREFWNNVRSAFGDRPDFGDLAEKLSRKFELLYESEIVTLVQKLAGYAKQESLSKETMKEINDILVQTSEIPKAPWDEGICKVCGVDKDDDSVLLCDTCDAEYHTYCLDPPLARIPEGNWYCPSCAIGSHMVQDAPEHSQVGGRCKGKKYHGEITRLYLEALRHLTTVMEETEYWEFNVHERTFLLKFLCDELLNSALIRQHLEQCAEATAELQQKLRSFAVEIKILKSREETVASRAAKVETSMISSTGEVSVKEWPETAIRNNGKCIGQPQNSSSKSNSSVVSAPEESGPMNPSDTECQLEDAHCDNSKMPSQRNDNSANTNELPLGNSLPQEIDNLSGNHSQDNLQELARGASSPLPPSNNQGLNVPNEMMSPHVAEDTCPVAVNKPQAYNLELNNIKNDIDLLQESITTSEQQLLKLSVRRDFLGSDSGGRLYWVSAMPGMHPCILVYGRSTLQPKRKILDSRCSIDKDLQKSISSGSDIYSNSEGSQASCPFQYDPNITNATSSQWFLYQTDVEVEELICWLRDNYPKERELKESILNWKRIRLQDSQHTRKRSPDAPKNALPTPIPSDKAACFDCLVTKAATLLEKKYGPWFESETSEVLKKGGKRARVTCQDKIYRCECLEPVWPSRNHCLSCHKTFSSDIEFEEHNDKCNLAPTAHQKSKEASNSVKGKGNKKSDIPREASSAAMEVVETSKPSGLIRFQNDGCPFDLNEISSKFLTQDSNKELVQEIGLLGSKGIPSLIPSLSPLLSDPTLILMSPQKDEGIPESPSKAAETVSSSQGNQGKKNAVSDNVADDTYWKSTSNGKHEVLKSKKPAFACSGQSDMKTSLHGHIPKVGSSQCCVVPQCSLRPLIGRTSQIKRRLKVNLLDMDAALPEEALRPSKNHLEQRWAWRSFVKSAETIYEMVQATITLEDMIKSEFLRNEWWYWSSLSAAAKTSTMSSLALRIYSLDAAIIYDKSAMDSNPDNSLKVNSILEHKPLPSVELAEKSKVSRKSNRKRKEPEG